MSAHTCMPMLAKNHAQHFVSFYQIIIYINKIAYLCKQSFSGEYS